jgi:hypothetical protein
MCLTYRPFFYDPDALADVIAPGHVEANGGIDYCAVLRRNPDQPLFGTRVRLPACVFVRRLNRIARRIKIASNCWRRVTRVGVNRQRSVLKSV